MDDKVATTPQPSNPERSLLIRGYWSKFRWRAIIMIITAQCTTIAFMFVFLELLGITKLGWTGVAEIVLIFSVVIAGLTVALFKILGQPFRDLVKAVIMTIGEQSSDLPPDPNAYEKQNDGFKEILQTVYELADKKQIKPIQVETLDGAIKSGLANMQTGLVIIDQHGTLVFHNGCAPVRPGTTNYELDLLFPQDEPFETWLEDVRQNKDTDEHQWTRVADKPPGEQDRRIFDISASFRKGNRAEVVLTFFDRTNIYTPEEDDLDFISFAAHELRGPITVIRGYLDVLEDELGPLMQQDQHMLVERLIVTSNRLSSYINNILNAAKYDRRHMKLHLAEETVKRIYDIIADDMQLRASAQNRVLTIDIPENLPTVAADAHSIGEVIGNLLDNAIKYSNEGGHIQVTARPIAGFVQITVVDRGIGIPSSVMPYLFHKFYRSHRSRDTVAGTGIGLYICKAIVSSHGGKIVASSVENEGSTFSFTLPIYDTVAQKIKSGDNSNISLIEHGSGWIKNHSMLRG